MLSEVIAKPLRLPGMVFTGKHSEAKKKPVYGQWQIKKPTETPLGEFASLHPSKDTQTCKLAENRLMPENSPETAPEEIW